MRGWDRVCLDTVYFAENWKPKTIKIKNKKVTVHKIFTDHMPKFTIHEQWIVQEGLSWKKKLKKKKKEANAHLSKHHHSETEKERETVRPDEKNKNKKGIKNNKEIIFNWSCKKIKVLTLSVL